MKPLRQSSVHLALSLALLGGCSRLSGARIVDATYKPEVLASYEVNRTLPAGSRGALVEAEGEVATLERVPANPTTGALADPGLPAPALQTGGQLIVRVENSGQRYHVALEIGGHTFKCPDVTDQAQCVLSGLPQGLGTLHVSGSSSFAKEIGVGDSTRVSLDREGYWGVVFGLLATGLGTGLMLRTDVGTVPFSLGAGLAGGGATSALYDAERSHAVVRVETDTSQLKFHARNLQLRWGLAF